MAKDPATLWYWNDWQGGTITFTRHLKGCYMDLLHAQFNNGRLSLDEIKTVLGADFSYWNTLQKKFVKDDSGLYYNVKAEEVQTKRRAFSESRRNNLTKKKDYPHMESHMGTHMEAHMENENENEIINVIALKDKSEPSGKALEQHLLQTWGGKDGRVSPSLAKQYIELGDKHGWDKLFEAIETAEVYNKKSFAYVKAILEPSQTKSGEEKRSENAMEAYLRKKGAK